MKRLFGCQICSCTAVATENSAEKQQRLLCSTNEARSCNYREVSFRFGASTQGSPSILATLYFFIVPLLISLQSKLFHFYNNPVRQAGSVYWLQYYLFLPSNNLFHSIFATTSNSLILALRHHLLIACRATSGTSVHALKTFPYPKCLSGGQNSPTGYSR